MRLRPCIDIHDGRVKQIVGSSLSDNGRTKDNFVSEMPASFYAEIYKKNNLRGGHIIILNTCGSPFYTEDLKQAEEALRVFPGGMQIGGGINAENAESFLNMGASHVIVTSYVFDKGRILHENLEKLKRAAGKERTVLDLSCKRKDGEYYIVTDRWRMFTQVRVNKEILKELSEYCDEFLIHAADVEGKKVGIDEELVRVLSEYEGIPVTYAGGVSGIEDLEEIKMIGKGKIDVTVGSALDLFGGKIRLEDLREYF